MGPSLGANEEEEEDSIHCDESLSEDAGCAGWGGAIGIGWAMYRGTPRNGAAGLKKGLSMGVVKARWKNMYRQTQEVAIEYNESIKR